MKTDYPSQIGERDFFWIQDWKTKIWILGRRKRFKNGRLKDIGGDRERRKVYSAQPLRP